jgi:opacity protein-like surface antigen
MLMNRRSLVAHRPKIVAAAGAMLLLLGNVPAAEAQSGAMGPFRGLFTPFIATTTGGEVTDPRVTFGASVAVHEQDGWGAELDFGHAGDAEAGSLELDVTTYMVNASWVRPEGRIRPFGLAGGGVVQLDGCGSCNRPSRTYDFGWTAGGGVLALLNDTVGVRGDARYFFSSADHADLQRPDNFSFWRVSIGVTLMWVIVP